MTGRRTGPWQLVDQLREYATVTSWCEWLELAGSLGRGAGDRWSDVDAALGVHPRIPLPFAVNAALAAARTFLPVAGALTRPFGSGPAAEHVLQYVDGRQLSLVVMPAAARSGVPNGAVALVDRSGRLGQPFPPGVLKADEQSLREWAFLAWWELGDAAKHLHRQGLWRAIGALDAARGHAWQLHAASIGVEYPLFGAVSVENDEQPAPDWMAATLPGSTDPEAIRRALHAMVDGLDELTSSTADPDVRGVRAAVRTRMAELLSVQPSSEDKPE